MQPVKAIFFDAAGVFYDRHESTGAFANRRLAELGYPPQLSPADALLDKQAHVLANEGRISHEAYWDRRLLMHGVADPAVRVPLVREVLDHTFDVFAYPGGRTAMAGLLARGFVLGIVTDTIYPVEWKMAWLDKVGVAEFVSIVACSSSLGAHKPQPEIYLNAVRQARLVPEQAAFVGHDAGELAGAKRAGLVTVAVNYDPEAHADYFAESLTALLDVPVFANSIVPSSRAPE